MPPPVGFPQPTSSSVSKKKKKEEEDNTTAREVSADGTVSEQLFPPGKVADLQKVIEGAGEPFFVGKVWMFKGGFKSYFLFLQVKRGSKFRFF